MLEAVYEGYLMHYGEPRAFAGMDADLRLLAGDALYALGLARLAEAGDLEAVAELSDLISLPPRPRRRAARRTPRRSGSRVRTPRGRRRRHDRLPRRPVRNALVRSVTMLALPFAGRKNP